LGGEPFVGVVDWKGELVVVFILHEDRQYFQVVNQQHIPHFGIVRDLTPFN
jgi:hypothetical protein